MPIESDGFCKHVFGGFSMGSWAFEIELLLCLHFDDLPFFIRSPVVSTQGPDGSRTEYDLNLVLTYRVSETSMFLSHFHIESPYFHTSIGEEDPPRSYEPGSWGRITIERWTVRTSTGSRSRGQGPKGRSDPRRKVSHLVYHKSRPPGLL